MMKNLKKAVSLIMCVIMLLCAAPLNGIAGLDFSFLKASAAEGGELAATGQCGGSTYWTFNGDSGTLTISGMGYTDSFSSGSSPFYGFSEIKSVVINNGITGIGSYMFEGCTGIENISLPNSLISINTRAFYGCTGLTELTIPEGVQSVSNNTFANCTGLQRVIFNAIDCNNPKHTGGSNKIFENCTALETVIFGNNVTSIPPYSFYGCTGLKSITMGNNVKIVRYYAFCGCVSLTDITHSESLTTIERAFSGCTSLENIEIPDGVETISAYAFSGCTSLKSMDIPNSVISLGGGAFKNCSSLESVKLSENINEIGHETFSGCGSLTNITVPDSVTSIGRLAFLYCTSLKDITLSKNLTTIGDEAFEHCGITEITIPTGVEKIGDRVFQGCSKLVTANFYDTLKSIDNSAFHGCRITNVYYSAGKDKWNDINFISGIYNSDVPFDAIMHWYSEPHYKEQEGVYEVLSWIRYDGEVMISDCDESVEGNIVIPQTIEGYPVTTICGSTFSYCIKITGVEIPEGVKTIWNSAFFSCSELKTKVIIPGSVTLCGKGIFSSCDRLYDVAVADGNTVYDSRNNCKAVVETTTDTLVSGCGGTVIPSDIKAIGSNAFYGTTFRNGTLPGGLEYIGRYAFSHSWIENLVIPSSVEEIPEYAFNWADHMLTVEFPENLKRIDEQAFSYCRYLKEINIPDKTEIIGRAAFSNCNELESITLPDSVTYIGYHAFSNTKYYNNTNNWENDILYINNHIIIANNTIAGEYTVKPGTKTVAEYAFNGCSNLKSVNVPESVVTLCDNAFSQCTELTNVLINSDVDIRKNTFTDSDKVTLVLLNENIINLKVFAEQYGVNRVDVVYNNKNNVLSFYGTTTVYEGLNYDYITDSLRKYPDAEYMFFSKLVFDGMKKDDFVIDLDDDVDASIIDYSSEDLTFNHLYVNINMINTDGTDRVTFDYMLNAMKSGNGDAFSIVLQSDEGYYEQSIVTKIVNKMFENALNALSKAINWIVRKFR